MVIKADVALADLSLEPVWQEGTLAIGDSRITPYAHRMLETVLVHATDRWFITVRERLASRPSSAAFIRHEADDASYARLYEECMLWPLDYLVIEVARAGHRLRVRAGILGSVPVYCRVADDRVVISWNSADFGTGPMAIDAEVASHWLAMHTMYSARQLYIGVSLLTERASLHVEPGRASYRYPEPMAPTIPSEGVPGQDVIAAFGDALQRAISLRPLEAASTSIELSGGMDSASVATALAAHVRGIASKGILLGGDVRVPQVQRRAIIVERLGLLDDTVDIDAWPPDLGLSPSRPGAYGFYRDFYLEACAALWESARQQGRDVLFTGIGGDELFPTYANEIARGRKSEAPWASEARRHAEGLLTPSAMSAARSLRTFDAPASPVPATSLMAQACRAPDLLRRGQWPVNPLSDPYLVLFCHRLPTENRRGRETIRQYLQAHLGDDIFPRGYVKETFAGVLPPLISQREKTLTSQLKECALADLGLVDHHAVLALLTTIVETRTHAATSAFTSFLSLERCARQASS